MLIINLVQVYKYVTRCIIKGDAVKIPPKSERDEDDIEG